MSDLVFPPSGPSLPPAPIPSIPSGGPTATNLSQNETDQFLASTQALLRTEQQATGRIAINDWWSSTIGALADLIEEFRRAEFQRDPAVLSAINQALFFQAIYNELQAIYESEKLLLSNIRDNQTAMENAKADVVTTQEDVNAAKTEYDDARNQMNQTIAQFNNTSNPSEAQINGLNQAINEYNDKANEYLTKVEAYNNAIDHLNSLIAAYNTFLAQIPDLNKARQQEGIPPLTDTGDPLNPIPEDRKIDATLITPLPLFGPSSTRPVGSVPDPQISDLEPFINLQAQVESAYFAIVGGSSSQILDQPSSTRNDSLDPRPLPGTPAGEFLTAAHAYDDQWTKIEEHINALKTARDNILLAIDKGDDPASAYAEYNAAVERYNDALSGLNNMDNVISDLNNKIQNYNHLVTTFNSLINEANTDTTGIYLPVTGFRPHTLVPELGVSGVDSLSLFQPPAIPPENVGLPPYNSVFNVGNYLKITPFLSTFTELLKPFIESLGGAHLNDNFITLLLLNQKDDTAFFSLQILQARRATAEAYDPSSLPSSSVPASELGGSSLTSTILGLGSSNLSVALSNADFAKNVSKIFKDLNINVPRQTVDNLEKVLFTTLVQGALGSMKPSTKLALELLQNHGLNSAPVTLGLVLGLVKTLSDALSGGVLRDAVGNVVATSGELATVEPQKKENLVDALSGLLNTTMVYMIVSELTRLTGSQEMTKQLFEINASFARLSTQTSINEELLKSQADLGSNGFAALREALIGAFQTALLANGLSREEARKKAENEAEGVFTNGTLPQTEALKNLTLLALGAPTTSSAPTESIIQQASTLAGLTALRNAGLREEEVQAFQRIASQEGYFLSKVAQLQAAIGIVATGKGIEALGSVQLGAAIEERLTGEVGKSEAQILSKESLTSLHSALNILKQVIYEFKEKGNLKEIDDNYRFFKDAISNKENPAVTLSHITDPVRTWVGFASAINQGVGLGQNIAGTLKGYGIRSMDIVA